MPRIDETIDHRKGLTHDAIALFRVGDAVVGYAAAELPFAPVGSRIARHPPLNRASLQAMTPLDRITRDLSVMGGRPCIRGLRVTVGTLVGLLAAGHAMEEVLRQYPYLEREDILAALSYAAWRAEEIEVSLKAS